VAFCIVLEWRRRNDWRWLWLLPVLGTIVAALYISAIAAYAFILIAVGGFVWGFRRFGRLSWGRAGVAAVVLLMLIAIVFSFFRASGDEPDDATPSNDASGLK